MRKGGRIVFGDGRVESGGLYCIIKGMTEVDMCLFWMLDEELVRLCDIFSVNDTFDDSKCEGIGQPDRWCGRIMYLAPFRLYLMKS